MNEDILSANLRGGNITISKGYKAQAYGSFYIFPVLS